MNNLLLLYYVVHNFCCVEKSFAGYDDYIEAIFIIYKIKIIIYNIMIIKETK